MENQFDLSKDEELIKEAIIDGRKVQEYLWQELSLSNKKFDLNIWLRVFTKRINKIAEINEKDINKHPSIKVELRKRILQQAALSICALKVLDNNLLEQNNLKLENNEQ